jgi:hypothetical protein
MQKYLSELYKTDISAETPLGNTLRKFSEQYTIQAQELEAEIQEEYKTRTSYELEEAKIIAFEKFDNIFGINASATLIVKHKIEDILDDIEEGFEVPFPIIGDKVETT